MCVFFFLFFFFFWVTTIFRQFLPILWQYKKEANETEDWDTGLHLCMPLQNTFFFN